MMLGTPAQEGYKAGGTQRGTRWGKQASDEQGELGWLHSALPNSHFLSVPCRVAVRPCWVIPYLPGLPQPPLAALALHLLVLRAAGPIRCCSSLSEVCQQLSSAW